MIGRLWFRPQCFGNLVLDLARFPILSLFLLFLLVVFCPFFLSEDLLFTYMVRTAAESTTGEPKRAATMRLSPVSAEVSPNPMAWGTINHPQLRFIIEYAQYALFFGMMNYFGEVAETIRSHKMARKPHEIQDTNVSMSNIPLECHERLRCLHAGENAGTPQL